MVLCEMYHARQSPRPVLIKSLQKSSFIGRISQYSPAREVCDWSVLTKLSLCMGLVPYILYFFGVTPACVYVHRTGKSPDLELKAAVNTVLILSKSCMFSWVFRFAKNTNFLLKGGIRFFFYEDIPGTNSF